MTTATDSPLLSTREVCDLAGLTYRIVDYWARADVLVGEVPAQGSGSHRRYTREDSEVARVLAVLAAHGARVDTLREAVPAIRAVLQDEGLTGVVYVARSGQVSRVPTSGWAVDLAGLV